MVKIIKFDEIGSTQLYAKSQAADNRIIEDTIILAGKQAEGMGRFGRKWYSPESESLYSTIITFEKCKNIIQMAVPTAAVKVLRKYGAAVFIKWPNDIILNDKKAGGILFDSIYRGNVLACLLIGIGININTDLKEEKWTSVIINEKNIGPKLIIEIYDTILENFNKSKEMIIKDYIEYDYLTGKKVEVEFPDSTLISGIVEGYGSDCELIVRTENSNLKLKTCKKCDVLFDN